MNVSQQLYESITRHDGRTAFCIDAVPYRYADLHTAIATIRKAIQGSMDPRLL